MSDETHFFLLWCPNLRGGGGSTQLVQSTKFFQKKIFEGSPKGDTPEKKRLYVGIFPTLSDPPPVWERPCHKKKFKVYFVF